MSAQTLFGFLPGNRAAAATNGWLAASVGQIVSVNGIDYMLAQVAATDTTPANKALAYTLGATGALFTGCTYSSTANDYKVFGTLPSTQVAVTALDYVLVQISGPFSFLCDATIAAGNQIGGGSVAAGRIGTASITAGVGQLGLCTVGNTVGLVGYGEMTRKV